MRLGVISDTHDRLPKIEAGVALLIEKKPDLVVHAGDYVFPLTAKAFRPLAEHGIPFVGIFGNNDGERFGLQRTFEPIGPIYEDPHLFEADGRRVILTHKEMLVDALAKSGEFDIVLYGHTHRVDVRSEPCLIVNPGEGCGWVTGRATLAIVDTETLAVEILAF